MLFTMVYSLFYLFFIMSIILCFSFSIVLAHYYFKSKFSDFEEFSKYRYLTKQFKTDYDFIFKIKDELKMPDVLILFVELLNSFKFVYENKDEDKNKNKNVTPSQNVVQVNQPNLTTNST